MLKCFIAAYGMSRHLLFSSTQGLDTTMAKRKYIFPEIVLETTFSSLFTRRKIEFSGLVLLRLLFFTFV
jgi:hypothetical protein